MVVEWEKGKIWENVRTIEFASGPETAWWWGVGHRNYGKLVVINVWKALLDSIPFRQFGPEVAVCERRVIDDVQGLICGSRGKDNPFGEIAN